MTNYQVIYLKQAEKFFSKSPHKLATRIISKIEQLTLAPFSPHPNLKKLQDPLEGYRLRVGNYRIIYLLDTATHRLIVTKIDHRSNIYRN